MEKTFLLILIGILVLLLISLTVTIVIFIKSRKKWKLDSENQYIKGKEDGKTDAISVINATINSIENDKNKLNQMSEKELMVSTMMALASYGRRLDETNARLETITDYKTYISEMNKQMHALSDSYNNLQSTVKTAETSLNDSIISSQAKLNETVESSKQSIESFNLKANLVSENINILNSRLSNVGDIRSRVDEINTELSQSLDLLISLHEQSSIIMSKMNETIESYGQSPIAKIDQINQSLGVIYDWIEKIYSKFRYVDESDFRDLKKIEEIHHDMKELYDKFEDVDESDLSDLEKIEEIHNDIREIHDKLSCVNGSEFMNLYQIDDIYSTVSNIASRLNV